MGMHCWCDLGVVVDSTLPSLVYHFVQRVRSLLFRCVCHVFVALSDTPKVCRRVQRSTATGINQKIRRICKVRASFSGLRLLFACACVCVRSATRTCRPSVGGWLCGGMQGVLSSSPDAAGGCSAATVLPNAAIKLQYVRTAGTRSARAVPCTVFFCVYRPLPSWLIVMCR